MTEFIDELGIILNKLFEILWGWPLLVLLLGTHLYLTIILRCPQRHIIKAIKLSVKKDKGASGDVSQFGALATALASTVGTGNIIGVATAVVLGGPGAVLWCWLTGVFGIATKYSEGLLAVKYRVRHKDGSISGGPMYVLERGLHMKWLAIIFSIGIILDSLFSGNMVQSNSIAVTLQNAYDVPPLATAIVLSIVVTGIIIYGIKSIAAFCSKFVPVMAFFYIIGCFAILIINFDYLGETVSLIVRSAFDYKAAGWGIAGGFLGVVQYGVSRGLFSNEAGSGSAAIIAAAAKTRNPVRQALVSSTSVFWDTVIICALTGIALVSTFVNPSNGISPEAINATVFPENLTQLSFGQIRYVGNHILTFALFTFAFSTILGWSYNGEKGFEYLFKRKAAVKIIYRLLWIAVTFVGAMMPLSMAWDVVALSMTFITIPTLISLLLMSKVLVKDTRHYLWEKHLDEKAEEEIPLE